MVISGRPWFCLPQLLYFYGPQFSHLYMKELNSVTFEDTPSSENTDLSNPSRNSYCLHQKQSFHYGNLVCECKIFFYYILILILN